MSRAFVKDDDDRPEPPIARPIGDEPNYVTPRGLARLRESLTEARARNDARDVQYYEERIGSAIEVAPPAANKRKRVAFGATVEARDEDGKTLRVRIVGQDEAEPLKGALSYTSPFAQALLEHRVGETVTVQRPAGPTQLHIVAIEYEDA
jgi:transcription elongation GreA/GreB family factor